MVIRSLVYHLTFILLVMTVLPCLAIKAFCAPDKIICFSFAKDKISFLLPGEMSWVYRYERLLALAFQKEICTSGQE